MFRDINGNLNWITEQTIQKVKNQSKMVQPTKVTNKTEENEYLLFLPYKGKAGEAKLKYLQSTLKSTKPANSTWKLSTLERS